MKSLKERDYRPRQENHVSRLAISILAAFIICVGVVQPVSGDVFITLDFPGGSSTYPKGVSGNKVVGCYELSDGMERGFLYDGLNYTTLLFPGAIESNATAVSGNGIIGNYRDSNGLWHNYVYRDSTYITLDFPGAAWTNLRDISGGNIVGTYTETDTPSPTSFGFLYDGVNYTTIAPPGAVESNAIAVSGNGIVGGYRDGNDQWHGYLYRDSTYTTLDFPGAARTGLSDISGGNVVGSYAETDALSSTSHGFLYDGLNFTTIDPFWGEPPYAYVSVTAMSNNNIVGRSYVDGAWLTWVYDGLNYTEISFPGAKKTSARDISGDTIVGKYSLENGGRHGFLYQIIPEPSAIVLLAIAAAILSVCTLRRRRTRTV